MSQMHYFAGALVCGVRERAASIPRAAEKGGVLGNSDQRKARVSGLPCPFFLLAASIDEVDAGDDEGRADQ